MSLPTITTETLIVSPPNDIKSANQKKNFLAIFTSFGYNSSRKSRKNVKGILNEMYDPGEHF